MRCTKPSRRESVPLLSFATLEGDAIVAAIMAAMAASSCVGVDCSSTRAHSHLAVNFFLSIIFLKSATGEDSDLSSSEAMSYISCAVCCTEIIHPEGLPAELCSSYQNRSHTFNLTLTFVLVIRIAESTCTNGRPSYGDPESSSDKPWYRRIGTCKCRRVAGDEVA